MVVAQHGAPTEFLVQPWSVRAIVREMVAHWLSCCAWVLTVLSEISAWLKAMTGGGGVYSCVISLPGGAIDEPPILFGGFDSYVNIVI